MTRSMLALVTAIGCMAAEPADSPLLNITRVYVDELTGKASVHVRDMLINALQATKLFVITENPDRADAMLRGSAEDLIYTDTFQTAEGMDARASLSGGNNSTRTTAGKRGALSVGVGINESMKTSDRKHEAVAAVRLVNKDGDVIWATTQESNGAKFRGASADVADRVVKQLLADIEKARRPVSTQ